MLALLGALLVGLALGLTGAGGSILTVPVLRYLLQHPEKAAIAESLAIVACIALLGLLPYARERRVSARSVLLFGLPGMAGAFLGAWVSRYVPGALQLLLLAGVMLWAALGMWRDASDGGSAGEKPAAPPRLAAQGLGVGLLTGLVGVGGGFLIIPGLTLIGGLPMRTAVGTSLAIIALQSAAGFAKHLSVLASLGLAVHWPTIGVFAAAGSAGSLAGHAIGSKISAGLLRRGFAVLLLIVASAMLIRELRSIAPTGFREDRTPQSKMIGPARPTQGEQT
jgi:hypothetical protein